MTFPQGPFRSQKNLVLASASPRRQMLLSMLGISFLVVPSMAKEPLPQKKELPHDYAGRSAEFKARDVSKRNPQDIILAADTIVVLDNQILGKPQDHDQALRMLSQLNGRTHSVITACCLLEPKKNPLIFHVLSQVTFATWPQTLLAAYADTEEPMDKAGAYALQGTGSFLVKNIEGSHSNIIGLPLTETVEALLQIQAISIVGKK